MSHREADEKESRRPRPGGNPRSLSTLAPRKAHWLSFSLRDSLSEAIASISDQFLNFSVSEDRGRTSSSVPTTAV